MAVSRDQTAVSIPEGMTSRPLGIRETAPLLEGTELSTRARDCLTNETHALVSNGRLSRSLHPRLCGVLTSITTPTRRKGRRKSAWTRERRGCLRPHALVVSPVGSVGFPIDGRKLASQLLLLRHFLLSPSFFLSRFSNFNLCRLFASGMMLFCDRRGRHVHRPPNNTHVLKSAKEIPILEAPSGCWDPRSGDCP